MQSDAQEDVFSGRVPSPPQAGLLAGHSSAALSTIPGETYGRLLHTDPSSSPHLLPPLPLQSPGPAPAPAAGPAPGTAEQGTGGGAAQVAPVPTVETAPVAQDVAP